MPTPTFLDVQSALRRRLRVWVAVPSLLLLVLVATYRFADGQPVAGWVDVAWALGIAFGLAMSHWQGHEEQGGAVMGLFSSAGCAASIHLVGLPAMFWLFPVLLGNYAVASRRVATVLSVSVVASLALSAAPMVDAEGHMAFVIAAVLVVVFAVVTVVHVDTLHGQLSDLAHLDALTGAGNRRAFQGVVHELLATDDGDAPCALAILDVDHFKNINDEHGHAAGDRVLTELAGLVRRLKRPQDGFFRIGGEEFVLLMPRTDVDEAKGELELIAAAVRQKIRVRGRAVTVSIGLGMREHDRELVPWLARADEALYAAKRRGRDRLVVAETDGVAAPVTGEAVLHA